MLRRPPFSIKVEFHVEHPLEGETKVYINCSGHMKKIFLQSDFHET